MVIKPQELAEKYRQKNATQLARLEHFIDKKLVENFVPENIDGVCIAFERGLAQMTIREIQERYQAAGWTVKYESDQREGDYLRFTARRGVMKIFYDVDTQNDFMNKDGALYVPGAEEIKPNLKLLTDYARKNQVPVVGSVDKHFGTEEYKAREGELKLWGGPFPNHCMNDTLGQRKIDETIMPADMSFQGAPENGDNGIYLENTLVKEDRINIARALVAITGRVWPRCLVKTGLYFEKQSYDVFTNPNLKIFLEMADVREAVIYGVATDFCVKAAVLGMQKQNIQCYVVEDAVRGVFPDKTKQALEEMARAGAKFVTTKDVLEGRL
jgi:nicotinamidase/pyrazinamidase